jgi:energy-coupling factor transporter ATP-binding protein EcfA2
MTERFYTASLSRNQGRNTWAIIFRHPKRIDPATGKGGLRVRQSLKTDNDNEAEQLRVQMNELLASPGLWDLGAREQALAKFDPRIVDIFYYKLEGGETDFLALRDGTIELPSSRNTEYRRALFLGTTGAGKTTLLRQIIGTDPTKERFPSTSTAKTTVHETEVIIEDGLYRAAVTFFPMEDVREHLKECISAAVLAAYRKESDVEVMRRLLTHVNQRFRFTYILGNGPVKEVSDFDDDDEVVADDEIAEQLKRTNVVLSNALSAVKGIAHRHGEALRTELDASDEKDQRVIDELFEEELDNCTRDDDAFQGVIDTIMDEIEDRFSLLTDGRLQKTKVGWPIAWTWESTDRDQFIKTISRFSSNYAPLFGTLLTPLVNGVRVAGPFVPTWARSTPKLVLLDGEGLGHTPRSMSTLSTTLTRRIDMADAVILVDNAIQPMQAAPVAAMKELVSSGNSAKLVFAFTHFDRVGGDNLPSPSARAQHVLASAENVLAAIGEDLGPFAERALRARLGTSRVFLANLDQKLDAESQDGARTAKQLERLLEVIDSIVERPAPVESRPVYDRMNLVLAVKSAAESFHNEWWPRLGLAIKPGIDKEHWTRIKALSRRLATGISDEYDTLRPVTDLKQQLQQRMYVLLQNPVEWTGPIPTDDEKQHVFDTIAEELSRRLIDLASRRVRTERQNEWIQAFKVSGTGSTYRRADLIAKQIYGKAAPIPDVTPSPERNGFLEDVAAAIRQSAEAVGAQLR